MTYSRDQQRGDDIYGEYEFVVLLQPPNSRIFLVDITDELALEELAEQVGKVDLLLVDPPGK